MYQTRQTEALLLSVYLYGVSYICERYTYQVLCGKSNEGKETYSKGVMDEL